MASTMQLTAMGVVLVALLWQPVSSHGRLNKPPGRSTMWRYGYNTPVNYDDNQLFCGGFAHQVAQGYKCGVCGDPYNGPGLHEAGGKFANGIIVATYQEGATVTMEVQIDANHKGWFEFRICPVNDKNVKATHECLNKNLLQLADGSGTRLMVEKYGNSVVKVPVMLPKGLTCSQCVVQWRYHTGNSWGVGKDGRGCMGCGNQEEFYACADVKIVGNGSEGTTPMTPKTTPMETAPMTPMETTPMTSEETTLMTPMETTPMTSEETTPMICDDNNEPEL